MTAQEMLEAAGFSDTPEGRAAFYEQYPTEKSFMQEYQNFMRNGGRMGCMSCGGMKKYQIAGVQNVSQRPVSTIPNYRDMAIKQGISPLDYDKNKGVIEALIGDVVKPGKYDPGFIDRGKIAIARNKYPNIDQIIANLDKGTFKSGGILDNRSFGNAMRHYADTHVPNFVNVVFQEGGDTQDQIMQLIQAYADMAQVDPQEIIKQLQQLPEDKQQEAIQQMAAALQQGQQSQSEEQAEGPMSAPAEEESEMKRGGIHLDPAKRGTFKAQASRMGMSMSAAADKILNAPEGQYSPAMRRKANFYKNFAKAYGGSMEKYQWAGQQNTPSVNPFSSDIPSPYVAPRPKGKINIQPRTTDEAFSEVLRYMGVKSPEEIYREEHPYKFEFLNRIPYAKDFAKNVEDYMPYLEFALHSASPAKIGHVPEGILNKVLHQLEHGLKHELATQGVSAADAYVVKNPYVFKTIAESRFKRNGGYINKYQEGGDSQDQIMQIIQAYAETAKMNPEDILKQLQEMSEDEQKQALQQMVAALQQGQQSSAEEQAEGPMSNPEEEQMEEEEAPMTDQEMEHMRYGGIPERYRKMGFTRVGAKRQSTRPGKKWMVLAKKGDKYKIIHGGYKGMQDFHQHHNKQRRENFWNRMGGRDSAKAKDPFSPLYWHKRFGTWAQGGMIPKYQTGTAGTYGPMTGEEAGYNYNTNTGRWDQTMTTVPSIVGNTVTPQEDVIKPIPQSQVDFARKQVANTQKTKQGNPDQWHMSVNLAKDKQRSLADLNYDPNTFSGKFNRAAVNATNLTNPNSALWALPDKGLSGVLKATAGIASGLSGSYLGYAKAFGNRNQPTGPNAPGFDKDKANEALNQVHAAQDQANKTVYNPTMKAYGGMQHYQGGGGVLTFDQWKTQNSASITGITDEATLKKLYDNYVKSVSASKTPDHTAAMNATMGFTMANNALSAMSNQNQYQQHLQQIGNTDNRFQSYEPTNPFGNYTVNAGPASNFGLVANTPIQDFGTTMAAAAYGGMYEEGGTYELTPEEIARIIQQGGEVEYV